MPVCLWRCAYSAYSYTTASFEELFQRRPTICGATLVRASGRSYCALLACRLRHMGTVDTENDFIWEPSTVATNL